MFHSILCTLFQEPAMYLTGRPESMLTISKAETFCRAANRVPCNVCVFAQ